MLDWNDLRYFLAVARGGSTLAACKDLRVSQTTVARRIAALEEALKLSLFEKRQAGYALTSAGEALDTGIRRYSALSRTADAVRDALAAGAPDTRTPEGSTPAADLDAAAAPTEAAAPAEPALVVGGLLTLAGVFWTSRPAPKRARAVVATAAVPAACPAN